MPVRVWSVRPSGSRSSVSRSTFSFCGSERRPASSRSSATSSLSSGRPCSTSVGQLGGEAGEVADRGADGLAVVREVGRPVAQRDDQLAELAVPGVDGAQHRAEVVDDVADELVAVGERVGQRGRAGQQAADRAALALQGADDVHRQRVDLLGVERGEQRLEAVEQHGEVERRRGVLDRDRRLGLQPLGAAGRPGPARGSGRRPG